MEDRCERNGDTPVSGSCCRNALLFCCARAGQNAYAARRVADCRGRTEALNMLVRADGEWPVIHQYLSCGEFSANRIDSDDNALVLVHLPPADGRPTGGTGEGHRAHRQVADVRLQTTWSRPSSPPVRIAARADELQAMPPRPLSTLRPLRGTRPSRTWTKDVLAEASAAARPTPRSRTAPGRGGRNRGRRRSGRGHRPLPGECRRLRLAR
ncbi:RNHCP domain-containing protein [Streptomyces anulatus]|uniref:RNHCP domain-containing protein n=1 Tax=Streptomyces anulatus TaxID=1892 RepID=UPI0038653BA2